jgi:carbonic anhydrase
MPHAIIRRENGRRQEVDFGNEPIRVEIYSSEETVEIFVEAASEMLPEERRRFALVNVPRHLFSEATAAAARRAPSPLLRPRRAE